MTLHPLDPLIPIIIAFVKQAGFDRRWNAWISVAVYAIWTIVSLAAGLRAVEGPITFEVGIQTFVTAAVAGFVSYQLLWKNLGEQALEFKTSIFKGPISDPVLDEEDTALPGTSG